MTMRPLPITIGVVSAALLGLTVWGACGLARHVIIAVDKWGDAAPDLKPTLATLNRPCGFRNVKSSANYSTFYSEGSLMPCGTLAEIATSVVKAGDAVVQTQLVERATTPHITAAMDTLNQSAAKLGGTADSLTETAHAATGTLEAATDTIGEGKRTIAAAQPLLAQLTANGASLQATTDTLNDTLKRKAVGRCSTIGRGNRTRQCHSWRPSAIADKALPIHSRPVPWYMQPIKKSWRFFGHWSRYRAAHPLGVKFNI